MGGVRSICSRLGTAVLIVWCAAAVSAATVTTKFTYQGQLQRGGGLYNGSCNLRFSLWDSKTEGVQKGQTITLTDVSIVNGVFTVGIDFGTQFSGNARWLEAAVECAGDADFTTLTPRQEVTATPYALGLRPGAVVAGDMINTAVLTARNVDSGSGNGLLGVTSGTGAAVAGTAIEDAPGAGVTGFSSVGPGVVGMSSASYGVYGASTGGPGVAGFSNPPSSDLLPSPGPVGVYGHSDTGIAISGVSNSGTAVLAQSTSGLAVEANGLVKLATIDSGLGAGTEQLCRNGALVVSTCASSSLRYKQQVAPFEGGLDLVSRLRPISFTWKVDGTRDLGLGAEDVAKVEPLLVTHNGHGEIEGVRYDRLGTVLINAIQQQQAEIQTLKQLVCLDHPAAEVCRAR